jgi:hypothetical protein
MGHAFIVPILNSTPENPLAAPIRNPNQLWPGWSVLARLATTRAAIAALLSAGVCQADVPTAQEDCVNRNAALCELNGVPYMHNGPCPEAAKTVRPPGKEDCSVVANNRPESRLPEKAILPPPPAIAPHTDLARIGSIERWLLPAILIGGTALGLVLFVFLLRRLFRRRRDGTPAPGKGKPLLIILAGGACGLYPAYRAAGLAFNYIIASYHNYDTFGPTLIASAAAVLAFVVILPLAAALTAGILFWLLGRKPG